jgi:hypothetical protein
MGGVGIIHYIISSKQPKKIPLFNCFIQFKNALKLCPFTPHLYGCTEVLTGNNTKNIFVIGGTPIEGN